MEDFIQKILIRSGQKCVSDKLPVVAQADVDVRLDAIEICGRRLKFSIFFPVPKNFNLAMIIP